MANYAVFRSDLMSGTTVGADLVSVKYMGPGAIETAIENGNIVKLDGLMTGEREVYKGVTARRPIPRWMRSSLSAVLRCPMTSASVA